MGSPELRIYKLRTHGLRALVAPLLLVVMAVVSDGKIAFDYYEKVSHTDIEALNNLAQCYNYGIGTDRDFQKAFNLYKIGSEHGHAQPAIDAIHQRGDVNSSEKPWSMVLQRETGGIV